LEYFFTNPLSEQALPRYLRPVRHLRHLLWPFALTYGAVMALRNWLFDLGVLPSRSFDVPVISVGNLEAGGTGKSPLVLHICELLLQRGLRVAVLSRGYGRSTKGFFLVNEKSTADQVGDEPLQAKLRHPQLTVAVCEDRCQGIDTLISGHAPEVIVLDDAFQHRWVRPSLQIITTPSAVPFWQDHLLPVGSLREAVSGAKRAQALVVTGSSSFRHTDVFAGDVFRYEAIAASPVHFCGERKQLLHSDKVLVLAGIAHPERVLASVQAQFKVVESQFYPDHHRFDAQDMQRLHDRFHSFGTAVSAVLITEKDAARLRHSPHLTLLKDIPIYYLPINVQWKDNDAQRFHHLILHHAPADTRDH